MNPQTLKRPEKEREYKKDKMPKLPDINEIVDVEADVYSIVNQWLALYPHIYGDKILNRILKEQK
jgi:hypothetical protein